MKQSYEKKLGFLNLHTGERTQTTYWANGRYVPEGLRAINHVLRDHRTGDRFTIDPELFDLLHVLQRRLGRRQEFHVISAYRSPASNEMLAAPSNGVAKASLHIGAAQGGRIIHTVARHRDNMSAFLQCLYDLQLMLRRDSRKHLHFIHHHLQFIKGQVLDLSASQYGSGLQSLQTLVF